jgi:hypothetical protein
MKGGTPGWLSVLKNITTVWCVVVGADKAFGLLCAAVLHLVLLLWDTRHDGLLCAAGLHLVLLLWDTRHD